MKYVRMVVWVLLLVVMVAFSITNWHSVEVKIWDNLILETKIPALVVISFLLGLVPMWLIHRGVRWRLQRRISGLESAHRSAVAGQAAPPPPREPTGPLSGEPAPLRAPSDTRAP